MTSDSKQMGITQPMDNLRPNELIASSVCPGIKHRSPQMDNSHHRACRDCEPIIESLSAKDRLKEEAEREVMRLKEIIGNGVVIEIDRLKAKLSSLESSDSLWRREVGKVLEFIKKAHHLDSCSRRYQPYPLRENQEHCNCGRLEILDTLTRLLK